MSADGFSNLLQKAEELCASFEVNAELPRVERSLHQILEVGQKLWSRTQHAASQDAVNVKAASLLGSKGYGIPHISNKLETLCASKSYEPLEPVRDTDTRAFLKNERDNALLAAIESTKRRTFEEAEEKHWESTRDEWEREKQRLLTALIGSQTSIDFSIRDTPSMICADVTPSTNRSMMDATELAYARQIYAYNDQVVQGGTGLSLISLMMEVAEGMQDEHIKQIWKMVAAMCQIPSVPSGSLAASRVSPDVQAAMINNAREYLESSYKRHMVSTVQTNLQQAKLGGKPATVYLVRSYIGLTIQHNLAYEDGTVEDQPVWPMIYFCLRCGDLQAALQVAQKAAPSVGEFSGFLHEYIQHRRLPTASLSKMKLQYRRQVRNSTDPFKRTVYCIIAACDLSDAHADVADKIDDFLWLRLSQIDGSADTAEDGDRLKLSKLQAQLLEDFGEAHFQAVHRPFVYFQVLLLTGQFEACLEFLSRQDRLHCHAVHIALVLHELRLLLLPSNMQSHLLSKDANDPPPLRRLNVARLVMMYTRKFEATDPREALQYFYFLRNMKAPNGDNLFVSCVSELVLETMECDMLLGKMEPDGRRKSGAIDKFHAETKQVIEAVAVNMESKGMFEEAVKLYDLAQNHEKVLMILNQLLCQCVAEPNVPSSSKDRIKTLALSIARRYKSQKQEGSRQTTTTFYLILDIMSFFDFYMGKMYDQAMEVMQHIKLLPLSSDDVEVKVNAFKYYSDEVRRTLPELLLAWMEMLLTKYKMARPLIGDSANVSQSPLSFSLDDGGRSANLESFREKARALITFAGMIPYRLPGDTNARLVQMEILMN